MNDEAVTIKLNLSTNLAGKNKNTSAEALQRIEKLEQKIADLTYSEVYKLLEKKHMTLVTSPIKKTNVILKNVNFQYAVKLWNYMQENIDDKSKHIMDKQDYSDDENLKKLMDETFFLDYLILKSLDKDENETSEQNQLKEQATKNLLEKIVYINQGLTEEQLKNMLSDTYALVKVKNMANIGEIQKIIKNEINKYLKELKKV